MLLNHYDPTGWEYTKPGWHEVILQIVHPSDVLERYEEITYWLYERIGKCERHCRWYCDYNSIRVKFRYERDYVWFRLTWQ